MDNEKLEKLLNNLKNTLKSKKDSSDIEYEIVSYMNDISNDDIDYRLKVVEWWRNGSDGKPSEIHDIKDYDGLGWDLHCYVDDERDGDIEDFGMMNFEGDGFTGEWELSGTWTTVSFYLDDVHLKKLLVDAINEELKK